MLIQVSYYEDDGGDRIKTLLFHNLRKIPDRLIELLVSFPLTGRNVGAVVSKIERDFGFDYEDLKTNCVELGSMAAERGAVVSGGVGLQQLVDIVLGEHLSKVLQESTWSKDKLTEEEIEYAALDPIVSLRLYSALSKRVNVKKRLTKEEAPVGTHVDVTTFMMGEMSFGRTATGEVVEDNDENRGKQPKGYCLKRVWTEGSAQRKKRALILISKVYALNRTLNDYRKEGVVVKPEPVHFGQLQESTNFCIFVPYAQLGLPISIGSNDSDDDDVDDVGDLDVSGGEGGVDWGDDGGDDGGDEDDKGNEEKIVDGAGDIFDDDSDSDGDEIDKLMGDDEDEDDREDDREDEADEEEGIGEGRPDFDRLLGKKPTYFSPPSANTGDVWHYMDRVKVPMFHVHKKPFFVGVREAMLIVDPADKLRVNTALKQTCKLNDKQIADRWKYNFNWFRKRVKRVVPPPRVLYSRLRHVYETFGPMTDGQGGAPLFNKRAWRKARLVLEEIRLGFVSDPPGMNFYYHMLDEQDNHKYDKLNLPLYVCTRGTNHLENYHKHIVSTFGRTVCGIEMADCLLMNHTLRFNQRASCRRRAGWPRIGHYNTWLIDDLQRLVRLNHNALLYESWSNTSEFVNTDERFGVIPLTNKAYDEKLKAHVLKKKMKIDLSPDLSPDLEHVAKISGVPIPYLSVTSPSEKKLFSELYRKAAVFDPDKMAFDWINYVDLEKHIFPKVPSQLRLWKSRYDRNTKIDVATTQFTPKRIAMETALETSEKKFLSGTMTVEGEDGVCKQVQKPFPQEAESWPVGIITAPNGPPIDDVVMSVGVETIGDVGNDETKRKQLGRPPGVQEFTKRKRKVCRKCNDKKCNGWRRGRECKNNDNENGESEIIR